MSILNILSMVGGLAFFMYGMELMGSSLKMMSGNRLQRILEGMTDSVWKAILLGLGVTAVIQSSSGTTVMVVSLVNSGVMKLHSAVGVIMGANIGTTVTAWILSLTGLEGSNLFVQLLKPTSFSPVLAMAGVCMLMFTKKTRKHTLGKILVGFAILMFGMETMSQAMKPLAQMPGFQELFVRFSNPLLGVLAGAVITAILQSSSASVGILQALCVTGLVPMASAVPIIMGQNIGTCITAALAVIGAKRNAKRAACVHLTFNIIGTVIFMALYYAGDALFAFPFADRAASPASIAVVHSLFNVGNTVILANFIAVLEKIAFLVFPETQEEKEEKEDEFRLLEERLLATPTLALKQAWQVSVKMLEKSKQSIDLAMTILPQWSQDTFDKVDYLEKQVDRYQDKLGDYLLKIASGKLQDADSRQLNIIMNCLADMERISDLALNIVMEARDLNEVNQSFSSNAMEELAVYAAALSRIVTVTYEAYKNEDTHQAALVEPLEEVIDRLNEAIRIRHIERLRQGLCSVDTGLILTDMTAAMERVSDHCSNIAVALIEIHAGLYDAHKYLHAIKEKDEKFKTNMEAFIAEYRLPDPA